MCSLLPGDSVSQDQFSRDQLPPDQLSQDQLATRSTLTRSTCHEINSIFNVEIKIIILIKMFLTMLKCFDVLELELTSIHQHVS